MPPRTAYDAVPPDVVVESKLKSLAIAGDEAQRLDLKPITNTLVFSRNPEFEVLATGGTSPRFCTPPPPP